MYAALHVKAQQFIHVAIKVVWDHVEWPLHQQIGNCNAVIDVLSLQVVGQGAQLADLVTIPLTLLVHLLQGRLVALLRVLCLIVWHARLPAYTAKTIDRMELSLVFLVSVQSLPTDALKGSWRSVDVFKTCHQLCRQRDVPRANHGPIDDVLERIGVAGHYLQSD